MVCMFCSGFAHSLNFDVLSCYQSFDNHSNSLNIVIVNTHWPYYFKSGCLLFAGG
jgi:hypothetical protein